MPLLTLTTDFGSNNALLANVKGRIYSYLPGVTLVDMVHDIPQFNTFLAAFQFKQAFASFPPQTVHYIFTNLYEQDSKKLLYAYEQQQHIFAPDNGFLTLLFHDQPMQLFELTDRLPSYQINDILEAFLHTTVQLQNGINQVIQPIAVQDILIRKPNYPQLTEHTIDAQVIQIDNFGNVILNVTEEQFHEVGKQRKFQILFMRNQVITAISKNYFDVPEGETVCLFNSVGFLEIAVYKGNAAELYGFTEHRDRAFFYNHIKITFAWNASYD